MLEKASSLHIFEAESSVYYLNKNKCSLVLSMFVCYLIAVSNQPDYIFMFNLHKIIKFVFKRLILKSGHKKQLLYSNFLPIKYSLFMYNSRRESFVVIGTAITLLTWRKRNGNDHTHTL